MNKITFTGALTIYEAAEAKNTLLAALGHEAGVEIDLTGLAEMDTAGMQILVAIKREAARTGRELRIAHGAASREVVDRYHLCAYLGG
jgi:anti-anti-sigma regulatory factor